VSYHWKGEHRKRPLVERGLYAATIDRDQIRNWWRRWPKALIGLPTGRTSDTVVLDIDVKRADTNGLDTLAELGCAILPDTPLVHTASGGLHLYFEPPSPLEIRNTGGKRGHGIGAGLDWRGEGGYVILPSQGSAYWWDPHQNLDTVPLAPVPAALLPRKLERITASSRPIRPTAGLSPYADRALDSACRKIIAAPNGEQEATVNGEAFAIGTLAGAGEIPADFARRALIWAAQRAPSYDSRRPWWAGELEAKIDRALDAGMRHPREARHA